MSPVTASGSGAPGPMGSMIAFGRLSAGSGHQKGGLLRLHISFPLAEPD